MTLNFREEDTSVLPGCDTDDLHLQFRFPRMTLHEYVSSHRLCVLVTGLACSSYHRLCVFVTGL